MNTGSVTYTFSPRSLPYMEFHSGEKKGGGKSSSWNRATILPFNEIYKPTWFKNFSEPQAEFREKKSTPEQIRIKLLKTKEREKILNANKGEVW